MIRISIWAWFGYWVAQIFVGDLGAAPALKLNHQLGELGLVLLTINLVLGALLGLFKLPPKSLRYWLSERRFWGVSAYLVLVTHVFFYFVNEGFEGKAFVQVVTKLYLIFGFSTFFVLTLLALTSNNLSLRLLGGRNWKRLHRLVYLAQLLLFGHVLLIEKADLIKYGLWLGICALLQILRLIALARRTSRC